MDKYNFVLSKINERGSYLEVKYKFFYSIIYFIYLYFNNIKQFKFETDINDVNEEEMNEFAPISNKFLELTKSTANKFLKYFIFNFKNSKIDNKKPDS